MIAHPGTQAVTTLTAAGKTSGPFIPQEKLDKAFAVLGYGFGTDK